MARSEIGSAYVSAVSFVKQVVMVAPADSRRACPRGPAGGGRSCAPKKVFEVIVKCAKTAEDVAGALEEDRLHKSKPAAANIKANHDSTRWPKLAARLRRLDEHSAV